MDGGAWQTMRLFCTKREDQLIANQLKNREVSGFHPWFNSYDLFSIFATASSFSFKSLGEILILYRLPLSLTPFMGFLPSIIPDSHPRLN